MALSILFIQANEVGFSSPELLAAENELNNNDRSKDAPLANKIVDRMVKHKLGIEPWNGKLPPPRISPPRTFGDALAKAKICSSTWFTSRESKFDASSPWQIGQMDSVSSPWSRLQSEKPQTSRSASDGVGGRDHKERNQGSMRSQKCRSVEVLGPRPFMGLEKINFDPTVPYRPTQGLVALFARTGGIRGISPRAPHTASPASVAKTYADAFAAMDGDGKGTRGRGFGGREGAARGAGQSSMIGCGGFDQGDFHPGYGGDRGGRGRKNGNRYMCGRGGRNNNPMNRGGRLPGRGFVPPLNNQELDPSYHAAALAMAAINAGAATQTAQVPDAGKEVNTIHPIHNNVPSPKVQVNLDTEKPEFSMMAGAKGSDPHRVVSFAATCGYAVDGLGFHYINPPASFKMKSESKAAMIRVTGGVLTHAKGITMTIEESAGGNVAKFALPRVWIKFTGLPKELREFVIILVVGSILGVTKAVDMKFTRLLDTCRLQVLVFDPNIIPQTVDVVIGDYLYELRFRVEQNVDGNNPEPMDMDFGNEDKGGDTKGDGDNNAPDNSGNMTDSQKKSNSGRGWEHYRGFH
ncbi:hypothetical protein HU200_014448 [Digitaria exilis]|uniref:Uncharacterized protein n=1 Tax=Digitaria exilis TaxID=1010633 RepID=A0A835FCF5_9POAL|nr:hypothetical protein HU200_014448 [Digitaria exilis]